MAAMLRDFVVGAGRRAYAPTSNTISHDDYVKSNSWFPKSAPLGYDYYIINT